MDANLAFHFARLANANPLPCFQALVNQIAYSYNDNMIEPVISLSAKVSKFS